MSLSAIELVLIAREITDISVLGLLLQFNEADMDAFKKENNKDLTQKEGTQTMLRLWNQKKSSTKARLVEALQASGMDRLAVRIEEGILSADQKKFFEVEDKSSDSTPTVQTPDPFDEILKTVAKIVVQNIDIDTLGTRMGFTPEEIHPYIVMNSKGYGVTYDGTLKMLRDWRQQKQTRSTERSALKTALIASKFIHLADDLFGEGKTQANPAGIPPQGASAAKVKVPISPASDAVPDEKLTILANHVPHGKYSGLSGKLGIGYNQAQTILSKHSKDYFEAMRECLGIWKDETGGSSAKLKEILCIVGIGGTLVQYIE